MAGAFGVTGWLLITTFDETAEVHPEELATVKANVPVEMPDIVELVPVPVFIIPPGNLVTVQDPVEGNPLSITLPVERVHVGLVMVPMRGAVGVPG
jgi:hypothetical protein